MKTGRGRPWLAVGWAMLLGAACAHDSARTAPALQSTWGESRVVATSPAGVTLILDGAARAMLPADADPRGALLPVRVTIQNRGVATLAVRHGDFALVGEAGRRYPALLAPEVVATVAPPPPPLVAAPTFMASPGDPPADERTMPGAGQPPVPALSEIETSFPVNWAHVKGFRGDRTAIVARVQGGLLPEGPLPPGREVSGLLYFTSAAGRSGQVALRADLTEEEDGVAIGRAIIPLRVTR